MVDGDEGYVAAGRAKDGSLWARLTWIESKKTVTVVTATGDLADSLDGKHRVQMLALSAKDRSSKKAVKESAR